MIMMMVARDGRACLLLGEAEVADFDGRAGGIAQVGQQVVALEVKVDHMPAVQVLHACVVKSFRAKPISASNLTQYTRIAVAPTQFSAVLRQRTRHYPTNRTHCRP